MQKPETLSTFEFFQKFPNEEATRVFFENRRWGGTIDRMKDKRLTYRELITNV